MEQAVKDKPKVRGVKEAQALADRIWASQSPDTLGKAERLRRIAAALAEQGLSMNGVILNA